jgi:hypothetical protein
MLFYKTEKIADTELGLLYRDRTFAKVLEPGVHRILRSGAELEVVKLDLKALPVRSEALAALYLTHPRVIEAYFLVADMGDADLGIVTADGKLAGLVAPRSVAFYAKALRQMSLEVVDAATAFALPERLVAPLARLGAKDLVAVVEVVSDHVGLVYRDGVLVQQL